MKKTLKIVKVGGKLIEDESKLQAFLLDFSKLEGLKILVHGGGNMATEIASKLGYETKMIDGRRITDANSLKVIIMTYTGLINKSTVAKLQALGVNAIGLCGADGRSIISKKREVKEIDFGYVGDIEEVNSDFISSILKQCMIPVFSAISCTREGELLNTNGDSVAAEIAKALSENYNTELYYCFDKKGVFANSMDENSVIKTLDKKKYQDLLDKKAITRGMLPKLLNSFEALENGVQKIYLGDARVITENTNATEIVKE